MKNSQLQDNEVLSSDSFALVIPLAGFLSLRSGSSPITNTTTSLSVTNLRRGAWLPHKRHSLFGISSIAFHPSLEVNHGIASMLEVNPALTFLPHNCFELTVVIPWV
jgi:hypothetical protein